MHMDFDNRDHAGNGLTLLLCSLVFCQYFAAGDFTAMRVVTSQMGDRSCHAHVGTRTHTYRDAC